MKTFISLVLSMCLAASAWSQAQAPAETGKNLQSAYLGEAQAANFYAGCARKARVEGYPDIAKLFRAASFSEGIHRDNHRRVIRSLGMTPAAMPAANTPVKTTKDNLVESVADERQESRVTYPDFIRMARREGVPAAVQTFRYARETERAHGQLFQRALNRLDRRATTDYFVCQTCGMTTAESVPAVCPVCRRSGLDYRKIE